MTTDSLPRAIAATAALAVPAALVVLAVAAGPGVAQIADTTQTPVDSVVVTPGARPAVSAAAGDRAPEPISPRAAFIRSLLVPGWGQAAFESYLRGGIYFAGWATNGFMIFRTQARLDDARSRFDRRAAQIEAELIAASPNPDSLRAVLDSVPTVLEQAVRADVGPGNTGNELRKLVRAREQQREDWIAWAIFWVLASGIDGYVTAHLADFPAEIDVRRNADRSISLGARVPVPRRRP